MGRIFMPMDIKPIRLPSVIFALALIGGIFIRRQGWPIWESALAITAVAGVLAALSGIPRKAKPLIPLCAIAGFFLLYRAETAFDAQNHIVRLVPVRAATLTGIARSPIDYFEHGYRFQLDAETMDGKPVSGVIAVSVPDDGSPPLPGDGVQLSDVRIKPVTGFRNLGGFDYERFMRDRGVGARISLKSESDMRITNPASRWRPGTFCEILRRHIHRFILKEYPKNLGAPVSAMTVGITGGLSKQERRDYATAGVAHLLAVSGLHVGFIGALAYLLFHHASFHLLYLTRPRWAEAGAHRKLAAALCIVAVFIFVLTAGASVSARRAGIMAAVYFLSVILGREGELLNTLAVSAVIVLVADPAALFGASFILSYTAVLSIILLFARKTEKPEEALDKLDALEKPGALRRIWNFFGDTVAISIVVSIATAPALMSIFNELYGGGIITNLVAIPLASFAVPSVFIAAALDWAWPPLGETMAWVSSVAFWGINSAAGFVGSLPYFSITGPAPALWLILFFYAVCGLWVARHRFFPVAVVALCVAAAVFYWPRDRQAAQVRFIDVGQGDATLVLLKDGTNILVDGGKRYGNFDMGELAVLPELRRLGIRKLDAVIATHGDMDHVGGLSAVLRQMRVDRYMDNGEPHRALEALRKIALRRDIPRFVLHAGMDVPVSGAAVISVLHPSGRFIADRPNTKNNNLSLMLMVETEGRKILLPADNEKEAEKFLLEGGGDFKADALKVAHHGSGTSTTPEFLRAVSPRIAVISVGLMNAYHMPAKSTLATLGQNPLDVYRTDNEGEVVISIRGGAMSVRTWKRPEGARDYPPR